ncbi:hypothetical protein ACRAWF_38050 [Streptomyces sp. L7]
MGAHPIDGPGCTVRGVAHQVRGQRERLNPVGEERNACSSSPSGERTALFERAAGRWAW